MHLAHFQRAIWLFIKAITVLLWRVARRFAIQTRHAYRGLEAYKDNVLGLLERSKQNDDDLAVLAAWLDECQLEELKALCVARGISVPSPSAPQADSASPLPSEPASSASASSASLSSSRALFSLSSSVNLSAAPFSFTSLSSPSASALSSRSLFSSEANSSPLLVEVKERRTMTAGSTNSGEARGRKRKAEEELDVRERPNSSVHHSSSSSRSSSRSRSSRSSRSSSRSSSSDSDSGSNSGSSSSNSSSDSRSSSRPTRSDAEDNQVDIEPDVDDEEAEADRHRSEKKEDKEEKGAQSVKSSSTKRRREPPFDFDEFRREIKRLRAEIQAGREEQLLHLSVFEADWRRQSRRSRRLMQKACEIVNQATGAMQAFRHWDRNYVVWPL